MQNITKRIFRPVAAVAFLLAACHSPGGTHRSLPCAGGRLAGDPPLHAQVFRHAAVAADHVIASEAGAEILRRGGNAVDAAVAVSFALAVVRPESCGIGGGGFMIVHLKDDPRHGTMTTAINYRETCPGGIDGEFYTRPGNDHPDAPTHGGMAVATPGTVAGLVYALEKYGTMDLGAVMAPAIRAARDGFPADRHMVAAARDTARWIEKDPARRAARFGFVWNRLCGGGKLAEGDRIALPELAETLELISRRGSGAFYFGAIAQAIAASVRADGGPLSMADLASYRVTETEPLTAMFAGRRFHLMPPPSSGGLAIAQTLGILERAAPDLAATSPRDPGAIHTTVEALKHAFADRAMWLGDPVFVPIPMERLLSEGSLSRAAARIDPAGTLPLDRYGTSP
ncbi:MAG TPA: gamma-glutamyltransferase, partial [Phycisphaerales bacterium]|nr:gamma-glutamyltransferase [Phycisphaerales bacterium]